MAPTLTEEAAEAICGGLHYSEFEFVGEFEGLPGDSGPTTKFTRGRKPECVDVVIMRNEPMVIVSISWPNLAAPPRVVKGEIAIHINCGPLSTRDRVMEATGNAVHKALAVYRDVLTRSGAASFDALGAKARP
jgi:hypothetical protein